MIECEAWQYLFAFIREYLFLGVNPEMGVRVIHSKVVQPGHRLQD